MKTEYEVKFCIDSKDNVREILKTSGAKLIRKEFLQKRYTFNLPQGHDKSGTWVRVRDEGDKITMSLKIEKGDTIESVKEICLEVDSLDEAVSFLNKTGFQEKSYQETKRELWLLADTEITIDEWPFLEPFVEIEGQSEETVKKVSKKLGFNYNSGIFGSVANIYAAKYDVSIDQINNQTPLIIFDMENPFI